MYSLMNFHIFNLVCNLYPRKFSFRNISHKMPTSSVSRIFLNRIESTDSFGSCSSDNQHLKLQTSSYKMTFQMNEITCYWHLICVPNPKSNTLIGVPFRIQHAQSKCISALFGTLGIHNTHLLSRTSALGPRSVGVGWRLRTCDWNSKCIANRENGHPFTKFNGCITFDRFRSNRARMTFWRCTHTHTKTVRW